MEGRYKIMAKTRILVVEDESIVAKDIQMSLKNLGYAVSAVVSSGEEAIKKAGENNPDLVLMDIVLQGEINGITAADQIRLRFNIPVIYLTAHAEEKTLERAKITEAFGYIIKPFENQELYTIIEIALYRHKMEKRLKKSEEWLSTILKSVGDAVIATDTKGFVIFMNPVAEGLTGWKQEDAAGRALKDVFNIINEETGEQVEDSVARVIRKGVVIRLRNHSVLIAKDGMKVPIDDSAAPIKDDKGNITGVVLIFRDISERKKAEETLIRSEKLRVLGKMAAGVTHDFNNLLAVILGNAQLLEKGLKRYKSEEIKRRLKIIARTAEEGGETVRRLQHFIHREVLIHDFTKIDLNEIVRDAIASTSPRWKDEAEAKGVTIKIKEKLEKLSPLLGSKSGLMEVLTNLIFNALEAMPEGGQIIIKTEAKENKIYLYFTDSGKGIPDRIKEKIFDPFFTTKGSQSSGLGLSVSYGIIKRHKGEIKVESTEGKGTTFTISIPIGLEVFLKKEKLEELEKISSQKILVIDDEEGIREVLGTTLNDEGHQVILAESGRKGLVKFKQSNFDLILTDLGMPEMSGWELAKKTKEIDPGVPVGLITGWPITITKEKMKERGIDFILSKPFDCAKILKEVNALLKSKER